jgi:fibronectin-binding autotransporter adhesin
MIPSAHFSATTRIRGRKARLLGGVALTALCLTASLSPAMAATYQVTDDATFRQAIIDANTAGDQNAVIVLQNNVTLASGALTTPTVPITINTGAFTLTGSAMTVNTDGRLQFANTGGNTVTLNGNYVGGTSGPTGNVQGGTALFLADNATHSVVLNNGTFTGGNGGGLGGGGGFGAEIHNTDLTNNGTLQGGASVVAGGGFGVQIHGGSTLTNYGTIQGGDGSTGGGSGVRGGTGAASSLVNHGFIYGGDASAGTGGTGVTVNLTLGSIVNTGTIEAGNGAQAIQGSVGGANLNLINSGTIKAGTGQTTAITAGNTTGIITLELQAGSVIEGDVIALSSVTTDTFRLGGTGDDSFDISDIGASAQYQNFDVFEKTGTGTWTITGIAGETHPWEIKGGTLLLAAGADLGDGAVTLTDGTLAGFGTVGDLAASALSTISPGGDAIGTLTVDGDYAGSGGLLQIQSVLGGDTSLTDLLVITGNSSGTTNVSVTNMGGAGGATVNGIKIVDVGGASTGTFSLLGDMEVNGEQAVVGGAYLYGLYEGTPTDADGDWYLRNIVNPDDPGTPLFQPGAPVIEAYAAALQGFLVPETLQQRVGSREWSGEQGFGLWGRMVGDNRSIDPASSTTGASYGLETWRLQAGADGVISQTEDGTLVGGITVETGTLSSDVTSASGDGSISGNGYGLGATLTYYGSTGFYLDAQARVTWFDSDLTSDTLGTLVTGNGGFGYGLSLEAGQKLALGQGWSVTPQAQLSYSAVDFDDFTDTFGSTVSLSDGRSLVGRLGISADYETEWQDNKGQTGRGKLYGIANLSYEFLDGTSTSIGGDEVASAPDKLWAGIGVGGSLNLADDAFSLHGEASYNVGLGGSGESSSVSITGGIGGKF